MSILSNFNPSKLLIPLLLSLAPAGLLHADVALTSGTLVGQRTYSQSGPNTGGYQLAGPGFSLSLASYPGGITPFVGLNGNQTVTFDYGLATTIVANGQTLVYGGVTYGANDQSVTARVWLEAGRVTVPATEANGLFQANASVQIFLYAIVSAGNLSVTITGNANCAVGTSGTVGVGETDSTNCQFQPNFVPFTLDTTTQGSWNGTYGGDAYLIPNGVSNDPQRTYLTVSGASTYTWAPQTSDPRALQNGTGVTTRIASTYYAPSFNINVGFGDYASHRLALYLLDFDTANTRAETITIIDPFFGKTIDSRTFTKFDQGQWAVWDGLPSNFTINVSGVSGNPAVLSGLFFGPAGTPPVITPPLSSASFAGIDTTTQGLWKASYGANGYSIANGASKPATYAALSLSGDFTYTWAALTTDARALQTTPGYGIASAFTQYPHVGFTMNVNIHDGASHKVSLYLLDWDTTTRSEKITITDASTNAVLDTQTFSGFHNGQYASWTLNGNVNISVTPNGTSSPAVSAIFFN